MKPNNYFVSFTKKISFLCLLSYSLTHSYLQAQEISFSSSGLSGENINNPTSLDFGPDNKLYVSQQDGTIWQFSIDRNDAPVGEGIYTIEETNSINLVQQNIPNHTDAGLVTTIQLRQVTGIHTAGTSENPIIYVTSSDNLIGGGGGVNDKNLDTNSGMLSKLTYNGSEWEKVDLVRGLPRCEENHSTNGMDIFTKDGITYMLLQQGGHTNMGAPSNNFVGTQEYLLSGSILIINLTQLESMPVYTDPRSDTQYVYDLPTLNDPDKEDIDNTNENFPYPFGHPLYNATIDLGDPFGGNDGKNQAFAEPNGPVQIFSPGYRNAYDVVVMENGNIYTYDNGPNNNWGGMPLIYDVDNNFKGNETNTTYNYEEGDYVVNQFNNGGFTHGDQLHYVGTIDDENETYYGGHPIPILAFPSRADIIINKQVSGVWTEIERLKLENLLENVSGYFNSEIGMENFPDKPTYGKYTTDVASEDNNILDIINSSTNGICEYTASNFDSALKGNLFAASFNGDITRYAFDETGNGLVEKEVIFSGFGATPLDVIALPDDHPFAGTVWAATYGADNITVFEPTQVANCVDPSDPTFDPIADYDNDGYTNQDEIDNGTNYCSGGSTPTDNDSDSISDLNDTDDDNDGILDINDAFAIDPNNGLTTNLPIDYSFFNNDPGTGFYGLGFTGLMLDPTGNTDYLDQFDPDNLSFGGAAGKASIDSVDSGDPIGIKNSQNNAFQLGINVDSNSPNFTIQSRIESPFFGIDGVGTNPVSFQSVGIYIGNGDQNNYLKCVVQKGTSGSDNLNGVEVLLENNGNANISSKFDIDNILSTGAIDIYANVKPGENTCQFYLSIDGGETIIDTAFPVTLPENFLDPNDSQGLAVGIIATSYNNAPQFSAVWDYFLITEDQPGVLTADTEILDFGTVTQNDDATQINLELLNESGPDYGVIEVSSVNIIGVDADLFSTDIATPFSIGPGKEFIIPITAESDASVGVKSAELEILYADGESLIIPINLIIEENYIPYIRINTGGTEVTAVDNGPDWSANNTTGEVITETYTVNTGSTYSGNLVYGNKNSSIPDYIDQTTYNTLFAQERFDPPAGEEMEFSIPIENGTYIVNLFLGNAYGGTSEIGERVFDIFIEDQIVQDNLDLVAEFGHLSGGMFSYKAIVEDEVINISFGHETENPLINAIEILRPEIEFEAISIQDIADLENNVEDQIDFAVSVSGGDPFLNYTYSILGQPDGIEIEPTNGQIFGIISETALDGGIAHDGVHNVTVTVSQENGETASTEFIWQVNPAIISWIDKEEDENYVARHECSFVQAGDQFILFGGRESAQQLDVYDYNTNTWTTGGEAPLEFNHFQAITYEGLVWVIGAFQNNSFPNEAPADHIYMYNPATQQWIQGAEIPEERRRGGAGLVSYNDKFYLVGGNTIGHNGGYVAWTDEYDPKTNTWTVLEDAPSARDHFHAVELDGKIYAAGGRLSGGEGGVFAPLVEEVDVFDLSTKTWSALSSDLNIPTPRAGTSAVAFENEIYIIGGESTTVEDTAYDLVEAFNPTTSLWNTKEALNHARHGTQAIVSGNGIHIACGSPTRGGGRQLNMEVYNEDNPVGETIFASNLQLSTDEITFEYNTDQESIDLNLDILNVFGDTGSLIKSIEIDNPDYTIEGFNSNILIGANETKNIQISFDNTEIEATSAAITIVYNNDLQLIVNISGEQTTESLIDNLIFYNDEDDTEIFELYNGGTFDLSSFEFVNIELNTTETIGSAQFILSGEIEHTQTESFLPYDVFGTGDNNGVPFPNGEYTLSINIYEGASLTGSIIETTEISFTVVGNEINIFPNPTSENITIDVSETGKELTEITIQDVTGLMSNTYNPNLYVIETNVYDISVNNFNQGVYILTLIFDDGSIENTQLIIE